MSAWFDPEIARWFSLLSLLAIPLSALGPLAHQGKYKTLVSAVHAGAVALGLVVLAVAGLALSLEQPGYIVVPLFVVGAAVTIACGATFPVMRRAYRDAENRRIAARNL